MNTSNKSLSRLAGMSRQFARRLPLTVRVLELLVILGLYIGGLFFVAELAGHSYLAVAVFAMFGMPAVLSVVSRMLRTIERRLHVPSHRVPHIG